MECKPPADKDDLDGMSQWQALLNNAAPPRQSIIHNIDPLKTVKGEDERQWVRKLAEDAKFNINSQSGKQPSHCHLTYFEFKSKLFDTVAGNC